MTLRNLGLTAAGLMLFAFSAFAQFASMEGDVKGTDGKPAVGTIVKIDRTDIKGHYQVKTDKKGHYLYAGLPLGTYNVSMTVDGKDLPVQQGVRLRGGDPTNVSADFSKIGTDAAAAQAALAAEKAQDATRGLSAAEKAAQEKQAKEREEALKKNKELNDAFNGGIAAAGNKQWPEAIAAFNKASEMDPKQHVVWAQLAEAEMNFAGTKSGADAEGEMQKGLDDYSKAI